MPLFRYRCPACDREFGKLTAVAAERSACPGCGSESPRAPSPPLSSCYDTIDNGFMTKRVERLSEVERMSWERSHGKGKR